jgi:hypothetical protein
MEFNDGSSYRVVTDPARHLRERPMFIGRAASARNAGLYVDTSLAHHRTTLASMPLLVWYQYVWSQWGPETQAQFLIDTLGYLKPNETVMLDIETAAGIADPADFSRRWLAHIEPRLKCRAWIYVPGALYPALAPLIGGRVVVMPHYSGVPTWPHDVHQYTDRGYFPGCPDQAGGDVNRTALTVPQLLARSRPGVPVAVSQNGYPANDRTQCTTFIVSNGGAPGGRVMTFRKGSPGELLTHMIRWFDASIRDIDPGIMDDWSYAERPIRDGVELSNHASGTAADVDATKWPLSVQPETYLSAAEIARVRAQLQLYEGCIRWGGDYTGRKDPMHFEINRDQATCDRVWAKISVGGDDMSAEDVKQIKDHINIRIDNLAGWTKSLSNATNAQVAGLTAAVNKLAESVASDDLTAEELKQAVAEALQENAVQVDVSVAPGLRAEDPS